MIHTALQRIFTLATISDSIFKLEDIKTFLCGNRKNTVYKAAFSRDLKKVDTVSAFDLLAEELLAYVSKPTTETQASFDAWHHCVCEKFLNKLNASVSTPKSYGKAQKAVNMGLKYAYCCHDANLVFKYKKFDFCHMALDGYTYIGANRANYPLSFCRDVVYNRVPRGLTRAWSQLKEAEYPDIVRDIRNYIAAHPKTFNDYLSIAHASGTCTEILPLPACDNRVLTPFEAEFFIWAICKACQGHDAAFVAGIRGVF